MFDINNLNEEYFMKIDVSELLEVKCLNIEDKIKCFHFFLTSDCIANYSVISNIFMLINGIVNIDDEALNDTRVFFNDLEEYVDIKLELKEEIGQFKRKLIEYYLGVIQGLNVKLPELKVHIPNTYYNILYLANPMFISKIMLEQLKNIDVNNIKPTFNAESIYDKINDHIYSQTYGIFQRIISEAVEYDYK